MSDENTPPAGTGAPAAEPNTPPQPAPQAQPPAAATPPTPPADPPADPPAEPHWLKPRLDQAERAAEKRILESLGVTDPKDLKGAKEAIEAARKRAEAEKTMEQRLAELEAANKSAMTEAERLKATATEHAARMMGVLTEAQQKAVKDIAGDDPAMQLKAITAFGPTWAAEAEAARAADPKPPPANTLPPKDAPGETPPGSPPDHATTYQSLRQTNPFAAAAYGLRNQAVYNPKS